MDKEKKEKDKKGDKEKEGKGEKEKEEKEKQSLDTTSGQNTGQVVKTTETPQVTTPQNKKGGKSVNESDSFEGKGTSKETSSAGGRRNINISNQNFIINLKPEVFSTSSSPSSSR